MTLLTAQARILVRKEIRQLLRSRGALTTSLILPVIFLVVVPAVQYFSFQSGGTSSGIPGAAPPGLAGLKAGGVVIYYLVPMFTALSGVVMPSVTSLYTIVQERERKTVELLVALPVRLTDIIYAKLAATLLVALGVMLPLFAIQAVGVLVLGAAGPAWVAAELLLLGCAMACSICLSFVLALLARDFRTSQQINGFLIMPILIVVNAVLLLLPAPIKVPVLAVLLLVLGLVTLAVALRRLTFERYLS
ncbi:MAG TPA: ABC transporter permease subunit [Candidatus Dormibacteraeota bacterium]